MKEMSRMKEKLSEYLEEGVNFSAENSVRNAFYDFWQAQWPLTANILDPVRGSVVCTGHQQIMQVTSSFGSCS